ncbi:MAG: dihydroorotate dehydrogenase (fumarate) [Parcubacteria group bacterium Gr01-1014_56]|nr:MAG: dihydroorotate dehydrogenase (fumarate) [Parcubacteria group bacterium Gr01-1014_56]
MTDVTVGSITMEERLGNSGDVYYFHPVEMWSLNSLGLPNLGLPVYLQILPEMRTRVHAAGKNLRVSVAGFSPKEYAILAQQCLESGADEIELNLGCPNAWGRDGQKPIASYYPELTAAILEEVEKAVRPTKVSVKISPVDKLDILEKLANVILDYPFISHIVATNTIPNQERLREDGRPAVSFDSGKHLGGLAGDPIRNETHRVIDTLRDLLPEQNFTAVGGIFTGVHALGYLEKDNTVGFQSATGYIEYGPKLFSDIFQELSELVS